MVADKSYKIIKQFVLLDHQKVPKVPQFNGKTNNIGRPINSVTRILCFLVSTHSLAVFCLSLS